jgi:hypothetical protein
LIQMDNNDDEGGIEINEDGTIKGQEVDDDEGGIEINPDGTIKGEEKEEEEDEEEEEDDEEEEDERNNKRATGDRSDSAVSQGGYGANENEEDEDFEEVSGVKGEPILDEEEETRPKQDQKQKRTDVPDCDDQENFLVNVLYKKVSCGDLLYCY